MKKYYMAAAHHTVRLLESANIQFPISKADLLAKVGEKEVQVDFDKKITMNEYCKNIKLESFANKAQFFNALNGSNISY
jgi:hypothetical protein